MNGGSGANSGMRLYIRDEDEYYPNTTNIGKSHYTDGSGVNVPITGMVPNPMCILGGTPSSSTVGGTIGPTSTVTSSSTMFQNPYITAIDRHQPSSINLGTGTSERNANIIIGSGTGSSTSSKYTCCLLEEGRKCPRPAGNASYSKRIQKQVQFKRLALTVDTIVHHSYICDYHKNVIQNARVRVKRESDDEGEPATEPNELDVDLYQLQVNTLRKYKKHFKISTRPGLNKAQLADILTKHFRTLEVNEKETVTYFIYSIKCGRNKQDGSNRPPPDGGGLVKHKNYNILNANR